MKQDKIYYKIKQRQQLDYIKKLEDELKIITKDFEKIYYENQKLKQELDKLKESRI